MRLAWLAVAVAAAVAAAHAEDAPTKLPAKIDFSRDVQPILSDNCFFCHGPDSAKCKGHLRLDLLDPKEGPFVDHDGDVPIVPGHPEKSDLVTRILSDDPDEKMPPPKSNRYITPRQIEILKAWVDQGASWGKLWSLVPPKRAELPAVNDASWCRNAIDRFVLAKLEQEGLTPSPEADKTTLLRRVTLDLTGLPPTPGEVDDFLADNSPGAYEKVVDRLLASPRYGERMVWEWLDAARYADTNGYQGDNTRTMWPWRDWVIKAINDNMPYDQFTIEQLAGDLLPNATVEDRVATAFCRNHMINGEGGRIAEENRVDYVMDQSETMSTVWLGLTVGCARCHDHKFDPITQRDYYSLFAFFNNTPVNGGDGSGQAAPVADLASPEQKVQLAAADADIKAKSDKLWAMEKEIFTFPEGKTIADSPQAKGLSGSVLSSLSQSPEKRYQPTFRQIISELKGSQPDYAKGASEFFAAMDHREKLKADVPRVMVMQEMPKPAPGVHPDQRRIRQAHDAGDRRHTGGAAASARWREEGPPGLGPLARVSREPADRPRHGQPLLAAVLRYRSCEDAGRFRRTRAEASQLRPARLTRPRVPGRLRLQRKHRLTEARPLGRQGNPPPDRHQQRLPAIIAYDAGIV